MMPASRREIIACPCCESAAGFYFTFYVRTYYHCSSCDLIFKRREQDIERTVAYYENGFFEDHAGDQTSGQRSGLYRFVLDVLEKHGKPGSLLDVGCGCGYFLEEARRRGWQIEGVDPSRDSIAVAQSLVGQAAVCGTLDRVDFGRQFDAVTLINVLDHLVDAGRQLEKIREFLAPEGLLYIRVPNGSFHAGIRRALSPVPGSGIVNPLLVFHEYAITPRAIRGCLERLGFSIVRISNSRLAGAEPGGKGIPKAARVIVNNLLWLFFFLLEKVSGGRRVWGPSFQVVARKAGQRPSTDPGRRKEGKTTG